MLKDRNELPQLILSATLPFLIFGCSPTIPTVPQAPSAPQAPEAPQAPSAPDAPEAPEIPTIPGTEPGAKASPGAANKCKTFPIEVIIQAEKKCNPNARGQSMPVEVRGYLLKDWKRFRTIDFDALTADEGKAIAGEAVAKFSVMLFPGRMKIQPIKCPAGVRYIALVGMFRQPKGKSWRMVLSLKQAAKRCSKGALHTPVHVIVNGNAIKRAE